MKSYFKLIGVVMALSIASGCGKPQSPKAAQVHLVETVQPVFVASSMRLPLSGTIKETASNGTGLRNFIILITLPLNVKPNISLGSSFNVEVPLLAGSTRRALVTKVDGQKIEMVLKNEIHDLVGQVARVQIPVETKNIFEAPVSSIFSPMGDRSFIFIVDGDRARQMPVDVLNSTQGGKLLLASKQIQNSSSIVTRGLDNLIDGDLIHIGGQHVGNK